MYTSNYNGVREIVVKNISKQDEDSDGKVVGSNHTKAAMLAAYAKAFDDWSDEEEEDIFLETVAKDIVATDNFSVLGNDIAPGLEHIVADLPVHRKELVCLGVLKSKRGLSRYNLRLAMPKVIKTVGLKHLAQKKKT